MTITAKYITYCRLGNHDSNFCKIYRWGQPRTPLLYAHQLKRRRTKIITCWKASLQKTTSWLLAVALDRLRSRRGFIEDANIMSKFNVKLIGAATMHWKRRDRQVAAYTQEQEQADDKFGGTNPVISLSSCAIMLLLMLWGKFRFHWETFEIWPPQILNPFTDQHQTSYKWLRWAYTRLWWTLGGWLTYSDISFS